MHEAFDRHIFRILLALASITLVVGTIVYHFVEKFPWVDAYYFSVITLATVGYGDFTPKTTFGKLFTTVYIFVGVGILTTFLSYSFKRRATSIQARRQKKLDNK